MSRGRGGHTLSGGNGARLKLTEPPLSLSSLSESLCSLIGSVSVRASVKRSPRTDSVSASMNACSTALEQGDE
eukprot:gene23201-30288_t